MKNIFILIVFISSLFGCSQKKGVANTETKSSIKKNINILLNDWHKAATNANYDAYFGKMDSISVFIGTDATENWTKKEFKTYSKPHFNKGKAWNFKMLERNIYINNTDNFVWFDELLATKMGTCRGSGVLEKTNNSWKIKHYVLSVAIPNNDIQKVILVKQKNDSIFLKRFNTNLVLK
jgi:hypothetical protein